MKSINFRSVGKGILPGLIFTTLLLCFPLFAHGIDVPTISTQIDPLDNWHWRNPLPQGNTLEAIAYGNGAFVAVGDYDTILTSPDGVTWTETSSGTAKNLIGVTYGNGIFVALGVDPSSGGNGIILTSPDGVTWTTRAIGAMSGVTYGNGTFVAVGGNNTTLTSPDGVTWTTRAIGASVERVTYGNGTFVAVGQTILTSPDGVTWTERTSGGPNDLYGVTYGNGTFVAVGYPAAILTSPDGATWTKRFSGTNDGLYAVTYGNGTFVAVGQTILTSPDGVTWTERTSGGPNDLYGVTYGNGTFVAVGYPAAILTSPDGVTWTETSSGIKNDLIGVTYGNGSFVAVGYLGTTLTSPDGVTWTETSPGIKNDLIGVTYGNGTFVAVTNPNTSLTSPDGVTWTIRIMTGAPGMFSLNGVTYGNGTFVAVGDNGAILTSPDGVTWTIIIWPISTPGTFNSLNGVTYGNGIFVAVGEAILTSPDGVTWTRRAGASLTGITYGNGTFVAVGRNGTILTSPDGVTWTISTSGTLNSLNGVTYGNGTFVTVGGTILDSTTGGSGTILTSPDGVTWTIRTSGITLFLSGVTYAYGTFVAVGSNGAILQSDPVTDIPHIYVNPTPLNFGDANVGSSSDKQVTVRNDGSANLIIGAITSPSLPFSKIADNCSGETLSPGARCTVTYQFSPTSAGTFASNSNIPSNDPDDNPVIVSLNGVGVAETVSIPNILTGPINGTTGVSYFYTTGGSTSNLGHDVQYLFDWGDQTNSGWLPVGIASASHSWGSVGTYPVKVQARCAADTDVLSSWSSALSVNISPATVSFTVTTNPFGLQMIVDGSPYTAPHTFDWTPESTHTLSVTSPQSGAPGTRYVQSSWSDGGAQTHTITAPSSSTTYTVTFSTQYELTITSSPLAGGTVTPTPMGDQSGIACIALVGVVCAGYYSTGTLVTLTATPNPGNSFSSWSGNLSGAVNPTSITMNGPKNIVANFTQDQYTLTVNINPTGAGSVTKVPDKTTYVYGDVVALTRTANPGFTFSNWSGDATGSASPITITMNGNKNVTVNFTQNQYTLTISITSSGSGSVTKSPDKPSYVYGEQVTLTAAPNSGYTFDNWTGDTSGKTNPITLTINGNKTVTAHFAKIHEFVSIPATPTGTTSGITGMSYTYSTGDSSSSLEHSVQYLFDWGDGTYSDWSSSTSASKSWTSVGSYIVRTQARCATDTSVVSLWSPGFSVTINTTQMVNLLLNPDFESGTLNWVQNSSSQWDIVTPDPLALSGSWLASMGGVENDEDYIYQDVTVPPGATTAYVDFWYWNDTEETTSTMAYDTMAVEIRRPSDNALLKTLVTLSNLNAGNQWIMSDQYDVSEFIGRTIRLRFHAKNNESNPTVFWIDDIGLWVGFPSVGNATRNLPDYYTPSVPLPVAITVTPNETVQSYAVEDVPSNGWIVTNINENGQWDNVNKKVKWGPFTDHNIRTLTYQVTPAVDETGTKTFSGTASFDGVNVVIGGDLTIQVGALLHPADTSNDFRISIDEVTAYGSAWKTGEIWPVAPDPIPIAYVTNAAYLWKVGEVYHYDGQTDPPWAPGVPAGSAPLKNQSLDHVALGTRTATRNLPNCYAPSAVISISITVNPGKAVQVYAVEDSPPAGWTVSDISESGGWDGVNKKVKWGPFFDHNNRTLTYKVAPPSDESGAKIFSGMASFDGKNVTTGGNLMLRECTSTPLPDLTGQWTTPVTQTCNNTRKGQKCTVKGVVTISNVGNKDASSSYVAFYLSDDGTYDEADTPLKRVATGKLKPGKNKSIKLSKSFPVGQIVTDKYIIAVIDKYNSVKEIDETINVIVFGPIQ